MDITTYINSGILELFVAGKLTEDENEAVFEMMKKHPEVTKEVLEIENAIINLTKSLSSKQKANFDDIRGLLNSNPDTNSKVIPLNATKTSWTRQLGWVASVLLASGLIWSVSQNSNLKETLTTSETENKALEIELNTKQIQLETNNSQLAKANSILKVLRDKNTISVPLAGQAINRDAYANAFWNKTNNELVLDLSGLPKAPEGKVYQIWSLTLNPLTPTDLGIVSDFNEDANKLFKIKNPNNSQAFGITLEPAGGSKSPTLEQLFTLGVIPTS